METVAPILKPALEGYENVEKEIDGEKIIFFYLGRHPSNDQLLKEYKKRGLLPAYRAVQAVNEADKSFADSHPNCGVKEEEGKLLFQKYFLRNEDQYCVSIEAYSHGLHGYLWYGGVKKNN